METKYIVARTGLEADFDPKKLRKGEIAVTTDSKKIFVSTKDGSDPTFDANSDVKQLTDETALLAIKTTLATLQSNQNAIDADISAIRQQLTTAQAAIEGKFGYALVGEVDKCLYIFDRIGGKLLAGPLGPFAGDGGGSGGGGGGGGSASQIDMNNTTGWATKSFAENTDVVISYSWSSVKDDLPTGDGTLQVYVNGAAKGAPRGVPQGANTLNLRSFLSAGTANSVTIRITDVYGSVAFLVFTITVEAISLESSFDATSSYSGPIAFPYTPRGNMTKTVHFLLDAAELDPEIVELSGRQMTKTIPAQEHGTHKLEVWFVADVDGVEVESNHLYFEFMAIAAGSTDPVISSTYDAETTVTQYETVVIPYQIYDPLNATAAVALKVNGETVSQITVGRTSQLWTYRALEEGELEMEITCRTTTRRFTVTVEKSAITIEPVTEGLTLHLTAGGRNNGEEHPEVWEYEDISAQLTNFNFVSDGWQKDEKNYTALRVSGDGRVYVPAMLFEKDARGTGKTIELEFATRRVRNYDAEIISCYSGNRGFRVTARDVRMQSSQEKVAMQYKEGEHIRVGMVVTPRTEGRMLYIYINGEISQAVQYPTDDDFSQMNPVGISIGSNDCTTDIYCIRAYDVALTRQQMTENWIADTQDADEMLARFDRCNIYDVYGNVVIDKLPKTLPYVVLQTQGLHLPQYKGDKVTLSGYYVDPLHPEKSFTFTKAQFDVQGTSSQFYERKNYKGKFKGGFLIEGKLSGAYAFTESSIPTNTFTFKADVASSEGANNTVGAKLYNDTCPYKTPAQELDARVRQGIEGYPCVLFEDDGEEITFIGKYNFNNDKGTPEVYGLGKDESIEYKNNTSARCLFLSDDFSDESYLDDFEWSNPEDLNDPTQMQEVYSFVVSCNPDTATGNELPEAKTYEGVVYTTDTEEYRVARFRNEMDQYFMKEQVLFNYLFTELMLMVDNRAKNMFLTFWGKEVIG